MIYMGMNMGIKVIKTMKEVIGILIDIVEYMRYEIYIVRHKKELEEWKWEGKEKRIREKKEEK